MSPISNKHQIKLAKSLAKLLENSNLAKQTCSTQFPIPPAKVIKTYTSHRLAETRMKKKYG